MWPRESLTSLKWSMSRNITPTAEPRRREPARPWISRSVSKDPVRQAGERVVESLMGELLLHQLAFGDVLRAGRRVLGLARLVPDQGHVGRGPHHGAVGAEVAALVFVGVLAGGDSRQRGLGEGHLVRVGVVVHGPADAGGRPAARAGNRRPGSPGSAHPSRSAITVPMAACSNPISKRFSAARRTRSASTRSVSSIMVPTTLDDHDRRPARGLPRIRTHAHRRGHG